MRSSPSNQEILDFQRANQAVLDFQRAEQTLFDIWVKDNSAVYRRFCYVARKAKQGGMKRWSARGVIHVLRWKSTIQDSDPTFKINNNISPMLARQAMQDHPELKGFFEVRDG